MRTISAIAKEGQTISANAGARQTITATVEKDHLCKGKGRTSMKGLKTHEAAKSSKQDDNEDTRICEVVNTRCGNKV